MSEHVSPRAQSLELCEGGVHVSCDVTGAVPGHELLHGQVLRGRHLARTRVHSHWRQEHSQKEVQSRGVLDTTLLVGHGFDTHNNLIHQIN